MLSSLFVILLNYHDDCCVLWLYYWYDVINANKMIHNELVLLVCFSTVDDMNLLIWSNPIHYNKLLPFSSCNFIKKRIIPKLKLENTEVENKKWTIQRNWQHRVNKTKKNKNTTHYVLDTTIRKQTQIT
jgi:hypothetical protein